MARIMLQVSKTSKERTMTNLGEAVTRLHDVARLVILTAVVDVL